MQLAPPDDSTRMNTRLVLLIGYEVHAVRIILAARDSEFTALDRLMCGYF